MCVPVDIQLDATCPHFSNLPSGKFSVIWVLTCLWLFEMQVIDAISSARQLDKPSVSYGAENLYMHGPLEELTRHNLTKVCLGP